MTRWLESYPGIKLLAYDHHPDSPGDLEVWKVWWMPRQGRPRLSWWRSFRGKASTHAAGGLLASHGDLRGHRLSHLSHHRPPGSPAAAWLIGQEADLQLVRQYAIRALNPVRLGILHRMMEEMEIRTVRGHRVGIVALDLGEYVDELAPLVSRCTDLFELSVLFALFGEGERITVISRGDVPDLHLGDFLSAFSGGGGHRTAASASVASGRSWKPARGCSGLEQNMPTAATAADLMISTFLSVTTDERWGGQGATPARRRQRRAGGGPWTGLSWVRDRQLLDAALSHGFDHRSTAQVMSRELEWVPARLLPMRSAAACETALSICSGGGALIIGPWAW